MIHYDCPMCAKQFYHKVQYETHLPCVKIYKELLMIETIYDECLICGKIYKTKYCKNRHETDSKCFYDKIEKEKIEEDKKIKELEQKKIEEDKKIKKMEKEKKKELEREKKEKELEKKELEKEKKKLEKELEKELEKKEMEELDKEVSCPNCLKLFSNKRNRNIHEQSVNCNQQKMGYKKNTISHCMKRQVWATHVGEDIGKIKCLCCKLTDITQLTFICGHIISESQGGDISIGNLLPICNSCNSSMGTKNLNDFMKNNGL